MAKEAVKSKKLVTPVFRGSFPNVFKAKAGPDGGEPKFGISAIWKPKKFKDKDKKRWKALMSELDRVSNTAFGVDFEELGTGKFKNVRTGLRDGEEKDQDGYGKGTLFANLTSKLKPGIIDATDDNRDISEDEGNTDEVYAGAFYRATVTVFAYDNKGKGIAIGLNNLQKVKDGDRLDMRGDAAGDFEDEVEDELDEDEEDDTSSKKSKKSKKSRDEDDEDNEDDEPKKKKKKSRDDDEDEDDEDERPKKKKKARDDDEDEDEDEDDEDDRPAKKKKSKKSRDEDDEDDED